MDSALGHRSLAWILRRKPTAQGRLEFLLALNTVRRLHVGQRGAVSAGLGGAPGAAAAWLLATHAGPAGPARVGTPSGRTQGVALEGCLVVASSGRRAEFGW